MTLQYGIEAAFYTWAAWGVIGLALSSFIFRGEGPAGEEGVYKNLWSGLKVKKAAFLVFLLVGGFFTGFVDSVRDLALPLYATGLGMDICRVGLILGFSALISVAGFFLTGRGLEKRGREGSLILSLVLVALPFFLFSFFRDIVSLVVLAGVFILGRAGGLNIGRAFASDRTGSGGRAGGMVFIDTSFYMGRIAGPLFAGLVIDTVSIPFLFFTGGAVTLAVVVLVGIYWAAGKIY